MVAKSAGGSRPGKLELYVMTPWTSGLAPSKLHCPCLSSRDERSSCHSGRSWGQMGSFLSSTSHCACTQNNREGSSSAQAGAPEGLPGEKQVQKPEVFFCWGQILELRVSASISRSPNRAATHTQWLLPGLSLEIHLSWYKCLFFRAEQCHHHTGFDDSSR